MTIQWMTIHLLIVWARFRDHRFNTLFGIVTSAYYADLRKYIQLGKNYDQNWMNDEKRKF